MDANFNMDTLDDSSTLPELSFDDLLDSSPVKKNGSLSAVHDDDDLLETDTETRSPTKKDDTLNTPGSKKFQFTIQRGRPTMPITHNSISTKPTPMRVTPINAGNPVGGNTTKNAASPAGYRPPILLNTKNVLPKTASQTTNNTIKITPKTVTSAGGNEISVGGGGGGAVGGTSLVSLAGKTAVRTSTGQLIYLQKTSSASPSSATAVKTSQGTTFAVKAAATKVTPGAAGTGNKPVTIQFRRTEYGNFMPFNPNATGTANKTLTLSPTSTLAGKKLITSTGGQVVMKPTMSSTVSTNSTVTSLVKPSTITSTSDSTTPKSKTILVHSSSGKQIMVSNSNLVKFSPQTQPGSTGTITGTTSTVVATSQGQVHGLQIPGKPGMQYVRVMPQAKVNVSSLLASTSATANKTITADSSTSVATTTTTSKANAIQAPVKILNHLPQKFTVLQKGTATKVVVTQKKDAVTGDFAPVVSKVQTSIVAVPTNKPIDEDNNKTLNSQQSTENQTLVRKHKISELNSELKRMTTTESDDNGPPEVKKPVPNSRFVVISSNNPPKLLNNSLLQPGRVTTVNTSAAKPVQGTKLQPTSLTYTSTVSSTTTTSGQTKHLYTILKPSATQSQQQQKPTKVFSALNPNGNAIGTTTTSGQTKHLYTILKPSMTQSQQQQQQQQQQQNQTKVLSALKPNGNDMGTVRTSTAASLQSSSAAESKISTNKQSLLQRQQKIFELKQLLKSKPTYTASSSYSLYTPTTTITSASSFLPIKIKEEPGEFITESAATATSTQYSVSAPATAPPILADVVEDEDGNQMDLVGGAVRRKHCNCSKSLCLKLYCDCFANGEFCQDCTCKDCFNNLENEDERQKAIKTCLERNPSAFKPKITSSSDQGDMRLHNKGCNCKRSGCLKNYCECYEAKIPCSNNCRCVGCRNFEERADLDMDPIDPKLSSAVGNAPNSAAGQKRNYANVAIKTEKGALDVIKTESGATTTPPIEKQQQCNFITQEVVDATIQCMITQADECEKNGLPPYQTEKMVMEELGRCLVEIIDFSIRNTDTSYSQD